MSPKQGAVQGNHSSPSSGDHWCPGPGWLPVPSEDRGLGTEGCSLGTSPLPVAVGLYWVADTSCMSAFIFSWSSVCPNRPFTHSPVG